MLLFSAAGVPAEMNTDRRYLPTEDTYRPKVLTDRRYLPTEGTYRPKVLTDRWLANY